MAAHRVRKGLDLPISGAPDQSVHQGPEISRVAALGDDTPGLRARMAVAEGDIVRRGQLLFEDRTRVGARYVSPGAGRVAAIFRGARRTLRSVVIQLSDYAASSPEMCIIIGAYIEETLRMTGTPVEVEKIACALSGSSACSWRTTG